MLSLTGGGSAASTEGTVHTLHDGCKVRLMNVSELLTIPVWKGNRILDKDHVARIAADVGFAVERLDAGYRIIHLKEEDSEGRALSARYLIDGQHRQAVVRTVFQTPGSGIPDFRVLVFEKEVKDEMEAIAYFRTLNLTKAIEYHDTNLQCNRYIEELMTVFNKSRAHPLIRAGATKRPYLSVEKLREALAARSVFFSYKPDRIRLFATQAMRENEIGLRESEMALALGSCSGSKSILESALKSRFVLALDPKLPWIDKIFREINSIS
jgi:dGTP triphosphohydrolase